MGDLFALRMKHWPVAVPYLGVLQTFSLFLDLVDRLQRGLQVANRDHVSAAVVIHHLGPDLARGVAAKDVPFAERPADRLKALFDRSIKLADALIPVFFTRRIGALRLLDLQKHGDGLA